MSTITLTGDLTITIIGADGHNLGSALIPTNARKCAPPSTGAGELASVIFGRRLKELRQRAHISQAKLAELMTEQGQAMSQVTVGRLEAARRPVNIDEIAALARIFQATTLAELISVIDTEEERANEHRG